MVKVIILCLLLQGCTYFIHNEYYQFIDKSKNIYDASTLFTNEKSSTELFLEALKSRPRRITGNSCGGKMYSDYPCMEAEGCIILN
jgi:hypothetical protein